MRMEVEKYVDIEIMEIELNVLIESVLMLDVCNDFYVGIRMLGSEVLEIIEIKLIECLLEGEIELNWNGNGEFLIGNGLDVDIDVFGDILMGFEEMMEMYI